MDLRFDVIDLITYCGPLSRDVCGHSRVGTPSSLVSAVLHAPEYGPEPRDK